MALFGLFILFSDEMDLLKCQIFLLIGGIFLPFLLDLLCLLFLLNGILLILKMSLKPFG